MVTKLYTELAGSNISQADVVVAWPDGIIHVGIDNHDGTYTSKTARKNNKQVHSLSVLKMLMIR